MTSNLGKGRAFAEVARFALEQALNIQFEMEVAFMVGLPPKEHRFDLVSVGREWIIECKDLGWREQGDHVPRAKITSLNEAAQLLNMLYEHGRKAIIMNRALHPNKRESLADYYARLHSNRLGNVMLGEVDTELRTLKWLKGSAT